MLRAQNLVVLNFVGDDSHRGHSYYGYTQDWLGKKRKKRPCRLSYLKRSYKATISELALKHQSNIDWISIACGLLGLLGWLE